MENLKKFIIGLNQLSGAMGIAAVKAIIKTTGRNVSEPDGVI